MPRFEHDCDGCTFLGTIPTQQPEWNYDDDEPVAVPFVDLYICLSDSPYHTTVISRYGTMGDYSSGWNFSLCEPNLAVARTLAIQYGLLTPERVAQLDKEQRPVRPEDIRRRHDHSL